MGRPRGSSGVLFPIIPFFLFCAACGDDGGGGTGPDPTGSLEVSLSVTGELPDADGCVFTVDGAGQRRLATGESTTYAGLSVGQHEVAIADVAGNCQVAGGAVRSVSVSADQTSSVAFSVACAQDVGGIEVVVQTTGDEPDADGYEVSLDGGSTSAVGVNGSLTFGGLTPADHTVALDDVASNCAVAGGNPRTVAVTAGQTAQTTFNVTCSATSGSIRVSASTSGEDLDGDGYAIVIDGGAPSSIGIDGSLTAGGLDPGDYSVELRDEAFNCEIAGSNPRTVTVTEGDQTQVTFDVTCRYHLYDRIAFQSDRSGDWMLYAIDPYDPASGVRPLGLDGLHPAVSPDGLRIVYSWLGDLWIARADGGGAARVTDDPTSADEAPAWSFDGEWIAFSRDAGGIWTMHADGSNQVRIFHFGTWPTWSPDGSQVAFVDAGDIWILNSDGSGLRNLTGNPTSNQRPAWSPLGNYIAFVSARDGGLHVFVQDPAGGAATNMTIALIGQASDPTWAPVAEAGAFASNALGSYDIYYFVPGTPGVVRLTTDLANDRHPSWGGGN